MSSKGNSTINGIVLSGGAGRRMKKEKGLCFLNGKPMISYVLEVLEKTCTHIYISANDDAYHKFGYPVIKDEVLGIGPLGGIYSSLKQSNAPGNLIISCDMPFISIQLIEHIINSSTSYQAVIPVFNGLPEPMCAYYNRSILPQLELMIEQKNYKLQNISSFTDTLFLDISTHFKYYTPHLFNNINSPDELAKAEKHLKSENGQ